MEATLELCDLGYGVAPGAVIDEGALPIPDYHVLWPGKPTTNTLWRTTRGSRRSRKRGVRRA